jgi:dTDP-4-dehydrorhamnose 3,5-epimerase
VDVRELAVPGAFELVPRQFRDERGVFLEWYRFEELTAAVGHPLRLAQANCSVSARGVVRGVHYADVPPSQAKYVTCASGALMDFIIDIRVGSPTFGRWDAVRLDADRRAAVYLCEGLGHAFVALEPDTVAMYLCSEVYNPTGERGINPLDPALGIDFAQYLEPGAELILSDKDTDAPSLARARADGLLPSWADCQALDERLRAGRDDRADSAAGSIR